MSPGRRRSDPCHRDGVNFSTVNAVGELVGVALPSTVVVKVSPFAAVR